ncbi:MAG: Spo0E family sporulation regulatory protein-aspartic acid phosphatase [Clostridium fessum]
MADMREELVQKIERARQQLNQNIDTKAAYDTIYHYSVELDKLFKSVYRAGDGD